VQQGDVRRFEELLADNFLCSNPDGSLVNWSQLLTQIDRPVTISGLVAEVVQIRLLGDIAIIHARTRYRTANGEQKFAMDTATRGKHPHTFYPVALRSLGTAARVRSASPCA
jgi:hypothetical protein